MSNVVIDKRKSWAALLYGYSFLPAVSLIASVVDDFRIIKEIGWLLAHFALINQRLIAECLSALNLPELNIDDSAMLTLMLMVLPSAITNLIRRSYSIKGFFAVAAIFVIITRSNPDQSPEEIMVYNTMLVVYGAVATIMIFCDLFSHREQRKTWDITKKTILSVALNAAFVLLIIALIYASIYISYCYRNTESEYCTSLIWFFAKSFLINVQMMPFVVLGLIITVHSGRILLYAVGNACIILFVNSILVETGLDEFDYGAFKRSVKTDIARAASDSPGNPLD